MLRCIGMVSLDLPGEGVLYLSPVRTKTPDTLLHGGVFLMMGLFHLSPPLIRS